MTILTLLLPLAISCAQKPIPPVDGEKQYANTFYVKASFEDGAGKEYPVNWDGSDMLYLYDAATGAEEGRVEVEMGIGKPFATSRVSTDLTEGAEARLLSVSGCNLMAPLTLPSEQRQDISAGKPYFPFCFACSDVFTLSGSGLPEPRMKVPVALVRVILDVDKSSEALSGQLLSIKFSCPGEALGGRFTLDRKNGTVTVQNPSSESVTVIPGDGITLKEGENECWICALPSDIAGKKCTLDLDISGKDGKTLRQTASFEGRKLLPGTVHTLHVLPQDALVVLADKSKPEFSYISVPVKKTMETASYSTSLSSMTLTVDGMNWMDKLNASTLDRWGGFDGVKPDEILSSNPAGFWRTGKYKGHCVMVNPDGNVTIIHGVNGLNPDMLRIQTQPESLDEYNARFSSTLEWAEWANGFMSDFGFNFYSCGPSNVKLLRNTITEEVERTMNNHLDGRQFSHVNILRCLSQFCSDYRSVSGTTGPTYYSTVASSFTLMYDPAWETYLDSYTAEVTAFYKDSPNFIGYYTDNEMQFRWADSKPGISLKGWIALEGDARCYAYAKKHAEDFIRDNYGVEPVAANITDAMESAFLREVSRYYYRSVTEAVRRHDPNHLLLGSRLHGKPMQLKEVTQACAEYNDVVSTNIYGVWEPDDSYYLGTIPEWIGERPCMISEFYTRNEKQTFKGTPYANTGEGGGWIVQSQKDRGRYYQNFTRKAISYKNIVGWQWFQAMDDYLKNYGWNNKGLAAPDFQYYSCMPYFRMLHWNIYQMLDYYCGAPGAHTASVSFNNAIWE